MPETYFATSECLKNCIIYTYTRIVYGSGKQSYRETNIIHK